MARVTLACGLVLIALGFIGYLPTQAVTALIPAGFGGVLLVLGALAYQDKMRKHAMHAAVLVGLVGLLGAGVMSIRALSSGNIERPLALGMQIGMAITCAVFVALGVRSFIEARRRRRQMENP